MIITLDWETAWGDDFSLSKMTTEEYVRDKRFKAHGLAIKFDDVPAEWFEPGELRGLTLRSEIENAAVLCHHAQFDGLILNHHYGLRPKLWLDTLSMARIALPHHRHSLQKLCEAFGLPGKQFNKLLDVKNVRDPSPQQLKALGEMSCDDADKTYTIFQKIKDYIPRDEYQVIDQTIRMFTEPCLQLDVPKMKVYHSRIVAEKRDTLAELGVSREELQSADKFAAILQNLGVEPATKAGKHGPIYAFAKTDEAMRELLEHDDERIAAVAAARLGIKSTIDETRCERLLSMSSRGRLAVYLRYAGAHPTRWSGGDSLNWQNFRRNEKDGTKGEIRSSILAPPEHHIVVADLSQVEARVLAWLAGQHDLVEKFRKGEDPYTDIASQFYGETVYKPAKDDPRKLEMEAKRGTGKQLILSCGYGAAGPSIVETAKRGTYGPPVYLTDDQGEYAKNLYRGRNRAITNMWWETAEHVLQVLESKQQTTWGPMEIADGAIWLPNGLPMWYTDFRVDANDEKFVFIRGRWRKMWGTKLVQHVCEGLARTLISSAMTRVFAETGRRAVNTTHDELMYVVKDVDGLAFKDYVCSTLRTTPEWARGLPLDAEGSEGERYGK